MIVISFPFRKELNTRWKIISEISEFTIPIFYKSIGTYILFISDLGIGIYMLGAYSYKDIRN